MAAAYNPGMVEYGIVGLLVLVAVVHLVRRMARSADTGCGAGCGCHSARIAQEDRLGKQIDLIQLGTPPDRGREKANDASRRTTQG
jgi:hypothetical protein